MPPPERPVSGPCELCVDAGADFDWCRVCGYGRVEDAPEPPESAIEKACRIASGRLKGDEVVQAILATHPPDCSCATHKKLRSAQ